MQAQRSQFAVKLLPSLADFAFLMPIVVLFGRMDGLKTLLGDCDTGWHIRTGEWILAHGWVPARDIFSFSKPGGPWFAWEWLSDVLFAKLNAAGGLQAVALFSILLLCVTFTVLFLVVKRKANAIVSIAITMLAAAASSIHWLARPHLFTLLFLVLFYAALEQVREGRTRIAGVPYLAILPVATILWTNLHAGFFAGALMIAAFGAGELLTMAFSANPAGRLPAWRNARRYFLSALACMAASLINPYTYHLHAHMAQYLRDPFNSQYIMEFLTPNFHHPAAIFFEVMLVLAVATAVWGVSRPLRGTLADTVMGPWRIAGGAQYPHFCNCGSAPGRRGDTGMAIAAAWDSSGRMAAQGRPEIQPGGRGNGRDRRHGPVAPGERCGPGTGCGPAVCTPPAEKVPRRIRSGLPSGRSARDVAPHSRRAHFHFRSMGRLPHLDRQQGVRGRTQRVLRQRF